MKRILFFDINPSPIARAHLMPAFEKLGFQCSTPRNRLQFDELKYPGCMTTTFTEQQRYDIMYKAIQKSDCDTVFLNGANPYYTAVVDACKTYNKQLIYWATEDPILYDYMLPKVTKHADLVLSPAIECVENYRKLGLNAHLMMFACNEDYHKIGKYNPKYDLDIILQASLYNHPARIKGYDIVLKPAVKLSKQGYKFNVYGAFWQDPLGMKYLQDMFSYKGFHPNEDIPDICASSKIVLGVQCDDSSKTQQSLRAFEILASGGFHLTQWTKSMDYWFKNGVHLVTVKNPEEAYERMKYYLKHESERNKIAQQGYEYVRANHTYIHRIKESILPNIE